MNNTPEEFDDIRPFHSEELPEVYERLLANEQFRAVLRFLYPNIELEVIRQKMHQCKTSLEFQRAFCYDFLKGLLARASRGIDMDASAINNKSRYTFVSNHRDIVLDSAFLDILLIDAGFDTTCEIAIGDNLLSLPWVLDVVRLNKSFIVRRGLLAKDRLRASFTLSRYIHYAIGEKRENIWIAQREGRAKNSDDRTQRAILKMLTLGGEGTPEERLKALHIVPLSISYEYDPCDYLKAAEAQLKRDNPSWQKSAEDDVTSMRTGIMGFKGHIHYHCAPCLDDFLDELATQHLPHGEMLEKVCQRMDRDIHANYRLYPSNYVAYHLLIGNDMYAGRYTAEERAEVEAYFAQQLAKISLPNKDEAFLKERILEMYANPVINQAAALASMGQ